MLFLLHLPDCTERFLFLLNSIRFSLDRLDFERDIVLLRDEQIVLLAYFLHLQLVLLLLIVKSLVVRVDFLGGNLL